MSVVDRILGILLLTVGLIWITWVLGGVYTQTEGFTSLNDLWVPMAFHATGMGLGTYLIRKPALSKAAGSAEPAPESVEAK